MMAIRWTKKGGPFLAVAPWATWIRARCNAIEESGRCGPKEVAGSVLAELLTVDYDLVYLWLRQDRKSVSMYRAEDALWSYFHATGQLVELTDIWSQEEVNAALSIAVAHELQGPGKRRNMLTPEQSAEIIRRSQHGD